MNKSILRLSCGYTFIELLIAIAFLGIIITPFLALFSTSFLSINNAGSRSAAINLCRDKMEKVRSLDCSTLYSVYIADSNPVPQVENSIANFYGFRRATTVEPFIFTCQNEPSLQLELLFIEITVFWEDRGTEKSETLAGFLFCR